MVLIKKEIKLIDNEVKLITFNIHKLKFLNNIVDCKNEKINNSWYIRNSALLINAVPIPTLY